MNIIIFGHVCIDHNTSENSSYTTAGGPGMFMNKVYKNFPDTKVTIVASYGADFVPYATDATIIPSTPNYPKTLVHENISWDGKKVTKAKNRDAAFPVKITDELKEKIREADLIFFTPLSPNLPPEYVRDICNLSHDSLKVLLPQGYFWNLDRDNYIVRREFEEANEIIPMMDVVIVSGEDHPEMSTIVKKWTQENKIISVLTQGKNGVVVYEGNSETRVETNPVEEKDIVDTVGSGDTFSAGFAYKYRQTRDIIIAAKFGNAVARQKLFYAADEIVIKI